MGRLTAWSRIANAISRVPRDPQIHGTLEIDASPIVRFVDQARLAGHSLTPTHVVGRAVGHALREVPGLDAPGSVSTGPTIDVFFITAVDGERDLSGVKVADVLSKPVVALADELDRRGHAMRARRDVDSSRSRSVVALLPTPLLRALVQLVAAPTEDPTLGANGLGLRPSPFGSAIVTSAGKSGIPRGFGSLAWIYDVPILVLVGDIGEGSARVDGPVGARPTLSIGVTIDHRYVDRWHLSNAMRAFEGYLAAPERFEPPLLLATADAIPSERAPKG